MSAWPRVVITGGAGRLGSALSAAAAARGAPVHALSRQELDVTQPDAIASALQRLRPHIVINAAARTAVDLCESEPDLTFAVNAIGAQAVAQACADHDARCIHISTDYVFGDEGRTPLAEDAPLDPLNVYGASKAEAERLVLAAPGDAMVVRTAWLFGDRPDDFIGRLLEHGRGRDAIAVVDDQFGSPTPILGAAECLLDIALRLSDGKPLPRLLHVAGDPPATRADWAETVFAVAAQHGQAAPVVQRIETSAFPTPARRPLRTALDTRLFQSLFSRSLDWRAAAAASVISRLAAARPATADVQGGPPWA